jgi:hypothetical protein
MFQLSLRGNQTSENCNDCLLLHTGKLHGPCKPKQIHNPVVNTEAPRQHSQSASGEGANVVLKRRLDCVLEWQAQACIR